MSSAVTVGVLYVLPLAIWLVFLVVVIRLLTTMAETLYALGKPEDFAQRPSDGPK